MRQAITVEAYGWALLAIFGGLYQIWYFKGLWPTYRRLAGLWRLRATLGGDQVARRRLLAAQTNVETQAAILGVHLLFGLTAVLSLINLPHAPTNTVGVVNRAIFIVLNSGLILLTYRNARREPEIIRLRTPQPQEE